MFECRRTRRRLIDYLDDSLPDAGRVERHIESCPACRDELESLRLCRNALLSVRRSAAPERIWARVDSRLRAIEAESSPVWRLLSGRPTYAFAAGLVLFLVGACSLLIGPAGHAPPVVLMLISPLSPVGISVQGCM